MTIFGKTFPGYAFIIGVVLVIAVGFIGYNQYLDHQDRQKFAEIEETVDTLVDRINEEFGTEVVADNSRCYKASRKLESEPTICVYSKILTISMNNVADIYNYSGDQSDYVLEGKEGFGNYYFYSRQGNYDCRLDYVAGSRTLAVYCSDYARADYYPFSD